MQTTTLKDTSDTDLVQAIAHELSILRGHSRFESPEAVAAVANVSAAYIRRIEQGRNEPSPTVLRRLCSAYGTTLAKFFTRLEQDDESRKRT